MNQKKQSSNVLPIVMMFALFFMISFVTGFQNPFGVIVKNQFGASNFMSQLGNFANFIAYAFMGIPAGMLITKVGYKKTSLLAVIVGLVGVGTMFLSGQTSSFAVYLVGAFISGFSMCMLNAVVNPMLNTLGGGGKKGNQLIQFGGSINSIGATIVPVLVGFLIGDVAKASIQSANPALFIAMGVFAVTFIVLAMVKIPEPAQGVVVAKADRYGALKYRHFILGAVAIFIYVGVEVGIPNFANLFMTSAVDKGGMAMDTTIAGTVVGTYWFLMLIGRLCGGIFGAKFSSKAMLTFVSLLGIMFVSLAIFMPTSATINMPVFQSDISLGFAQVPMGVFFLILCGLCTSVMWGGIFNLAVEGIPSKYVAMASGIYMTMVCGGGILPLIQGQVADMSNFMTSYWVVLAGMIYLLYYALVGSKNVNTKLEGGK